MHPLMNIAVGAARAAGRVIMRELPKADQLKVTSKAANDFVSEVDRNAEATIIRHIRKAYPEHAILAEETGASGDNEVRWIIDPLDGTTNFLHGFPQFAVSIGIQVRGRLEHGVIYNPYNQELYTASRGDGAKLDDRRIRVSRAQSLQGGLIGTGFPFRESQKLDLYFEMLKAAMEDTAGIRRPGAAALDLAYVAAGRLDAFWELGLQPWDMAAGIVLIREAGGRVCDLTDDNADPLTTGNIVAGNMKCCAGLLQRLRPLYRAT
ncbi:MAG: inositol monophosphatase family protein [Nevskiales bacterium]